MSVFSNRRIKTASSRRSKIDLSSKVITTNDFGFILPVFSREAVPGDHFSFPNLKAFARLAPMPVPTYAPIKLVQRAFYVRYRSVWKAWDDFYAGRKYCKENGSLVDCPVPQLTNSNIARVFAEDDDFSYEVTGEAGTVCDFYWQPDTETIGYRFTTLGRRVYNVLNSLGYKINFSPSDTTAFNILPILCYLRCYYDYFLPSKYTNSNNLRGLFSSVDTQPNANNILTFIGDSCFANFDNDYFTASWLSPNSPINNAISVSITDPQGPQGQSELFRDKIINDNYGSGLLNNNNSSGPLYRLSQFGVDALKRVYDWGMRKGLAGNRYFEDIFSQFGIKLPDVQTDRCVYLGSSETYVNVSDVMSTAQTEVNGSISAVGDYAGKGIIYSDGKGFSVDCNDFGQVIIVSYIIPDVGYVQGRNREVLHLDRLDFYNPEFDQLGMQPVRNDELFAMYKHPGLYSAGQSAGGKPDGIFGYSPRYSELKKPYDLLSGDFAIPSLNTGLDSYHSFRMFAPPQAGAYLNNSQAFRRCDPGLNGNGFNRIFNVTDTSADHFICVFNIPCYVNRKMVSLKDSFELDGGETVTVDPDCQLH